MTKEISLTPEQQKIVDCDAPAVLVKAAAGTGKTEILARRVERFINEPDNEYAHVMAITYTTRAADELKGRLRKRLGDLPFRITAQTIHGLARSILLQHGTHIGLPINFQVLSSNEDRVELFERFSNINPHPDHNMLWMKLDLARAKMKDYPSEMEDYPHLELWRRALGNAGAVDFAEMLAKAYELLTIPAFVSLYERIYGLIIVDEAQNLTEQQYQFLFALAGPVSTGTTRPRIPIILLGDPKQSIIRFAGADKELMNRFAEEFKAEKFKLKHNFRSARDLASLARRVAHKLEKDIHEEDPHLEYPAPGHIGKYCYPNEHKEGTYVADWVYKMLENGLPKESLAENESGIVEEEQVAVLARSSSALLPVNEALIKKGLEPAMVYGDKGFMATDLGRIAILLMRKHSTAHKMTAELGLRRELCSPGLNAVDDKEIAEALRTNSDGRYLDILLPLLETDNPQDLGSALNERPLPETGAPIALLAGWHDDLAFIEDTWRDFANITRVADRSWTRFALHLDRSLRGRDLGPGVRLLTVHKAQGREFKAVAVIGMNDGQFPDFRAASQPEKTAELNTFYVAVTRASRVLLLTRARERQTRFGPRPTEPSPYLEYIKA